MGKARKKIFTWGVQIEVFDCLDHKIGTIKEQIFNSLFKPLTTYSILDASGWLLAESQKIQLFTTDFTLTNTSGVRVAQIHRPWFNFITDSWSVRIGNANGIDSRLLLAIPAFKSAKR